MTVLAPVPIMMVQNDLEVDIMGFCRVATVMDNDDHVSIVQLEHIQTADGLFSSSHTPSNFNFCSQRT